MKKIIAFALIITFLWGCASKQTTLSTASVTNDLKVLLMGMLTMAATTGETDSQYFFSDNVNDKDLLNRLLPYAPVSIECMELDITSLDHEQTYCEVWAIVLYVGNGESFALPLSLTFVRWDTWSIARMEICDTLEPSSEPTVLRNDELPASVRPAVKNLMVLQPESYPETLEVQRLCNADNHYVVWLFEGDAVTGERTPWVLRGFM